MSWSANWNSNWVANWLGNANYNPIAGGSGYLPRIRSGLGFFRHRWPRA